MPGPVPKKNRSVSPKCPLKICSLLIGILILWIGWVSLAIGTEPVQLGMEGLEGEMLKNAQSAVELPPGLIRDGVIDRQLLANFQRQVPEKVKQ
ncbi:MAG: hypothetical protein NTY64_12055, partial [Deltaproteobacteria bacterium]|nr:hypothetical protein [Deltaproteobacteria bacterium]